MWSGGKDSYLALTRARHRGLAVSTLVNIYDQATGRVRFHAVRRELIAAQAFALGLRLHQHPTPPERYEETFRAALARVVASGHRGVVFGNIHLADVRAWFEERVRGAGLEHLDPLWHEDPAALLEEFIGGGGQAVVTCVETAKLPPAWLGRSLDDAFATDLARLPGVDPCGERGEYHTFVYAGPLFTRPIAWRPGPIHEEAGFAQLELLAR
ncbi:MAG: diphthine--ammonia ligase [Gemmatimonadales bacterium]